MNRTISRFDDEEDTRGILSTAKAAFYSGSPSQSSLLSFQKYLQEIKRLFDSTGRSGRFHKYITLIQSDGMGKTRLVSDFAKQHHLKLVYACYRKPGSTGFPLSVGNFYNCLMDILDSEGVQNGRLNPIHVCSSVLLQVIHMLLMEDTGQYDYQHGISENSYSYERLWQTAFNNARKCAFSSEPASLDFLNTAPQTDSNDPFRLFLVFDEASWMLQCDVWIKPCRWNQTKPLVKVDLFQVLRCSLHVIADHLVKFGVLPIFIDSDPAISKNFPLVTGDEIDEETFPRQIFPPYFHINVAPTTFCHIDWFLFGRPLWGAMHSQRKHPYETPEHETINFACQKWNYRFQSLDIWSTAVMCCLLDLEINVETQMKEEMIRSLMATCLDASPDRTRLRVHYPIEPVLARGALNVLLILLRDQEKITGMIEQLQALRRHAKIVSRGEIAAELFCLLLQPRSMKFDAAYPLKCFLGRLLFNEEANIGSDSIVIEVFGAATINLCQFHWFEKYPQSATDLKSFYDLGLGAAIFSTNASGIDLVVPVKLSDNRGYSAILLQIKNSEARLSQGECQEMLDLMGSTRIFGCMTHATSDCRTNGQVKSTSDKPSMTAAALAAAPFVAQPTYSRILGKRTSSLNSEVSKLLAPDANPPKVGRTAASVASIAAVAAAPDNKLVISEDVMSFPVCKLLFLVRNPPTADRQNYLRKCEFNPSNPNGPQSVEGVLYGIPSFFSHPALIDIFNVLVDDLHKRRLDDVEETTESDVGRGDKVQFANSLLYNTAKFPFLKGSELKVKPI